MFLFCRTVRIILLSWSVVSCSPSDDPRSKAGNESVPLVEAVTTRLGGLPLVERLSGTVKAENQITLYPEIAGRIAAVLVESGGRVERGQVLVQFRDEQFQEQLRQAEAGFRINEARVRQAKARLAELAAQSSRVQSLAQQNMVSRLELDQMAAQMESAAADVALAEAQLEEAAASRAEREQLLTKTAVRAPVSGLVGQRNAEVGMQVSSTTPLFTIGNLDRVKVEVNIPDNMLGSIQVGQPVEILASTAAETYVLQGILTRISPFLDAVTRSADAEIEIANPDHKLRPGMFVAVDVYYGQSREATLVPVSALFTDTATGREGVFVVGGATGADPELFSDPVPHPVQFRATDIVARGEMEIAVNGVRPDEWVVTLGQHLVADRYQEARVRPVTTLHVMTLQGLKREDLLDDIMKATSAGRDGRLPEEG